MNVSIIKEFNKLQKEGIEDADFVDLPNIEQGWTAEKEKKLNDIQRHIVDLENEINKMTAKAQIYNDLTMTVDRRPAYNSTYKKLAVQWLNEVRFFNQTLVQVDSFVLRNRQLLIAAKRYGQP